MKALVTVMLVLVVMLSAVVVPATALASTSPAPLAGRAGVCFSGSSYTSRSDSRGTHWAVVFNVGSDFNGWPNWSIGTSSYIFAWAQILRNKQAAPWAAPSGGKLYVGFPWFDNISPWFESAPWVWVACSR
jgi:hypothetical protein